MPPVEKLTIETPEQTSLEIPLAGIGSRFIAQALDILVIAGALLILTVGGLLLASADLFPEISRQYGVALLIISGFLAEFGYFATFEAAWNGQTPGKRWTHLRVIKDSGRPITAQDAVLRNLLRLVDYLPTFYALGIITILLNRENKRIGDFVAGTVVIHERPLQSMGALWSSRPATPQAPAAEAFAPLVPPLTEEELILVETYLERRASLDATISREIARRIMERLGRQRFVPPNNLAYPEKFLEALAESRRNTARFR